MRRLLAVTIPSAVIAVAVAGCGGSSSTTAATGSSAYGASKPASKAAGAKVMTRSTSLGPILVDGRGRSLYLFEKDKSSKSNCYGACASVWSPLTTATAGRGVAAAKLKAVKRNDGTTGVTYAGHPLYTYAGDTKPGDVKGEGLSEFGAEWYALSAKGTKVDNG